MKKIVLYLERDDVHAMVLERTKDGYAMLDYLTDAQKIGELLDKSGGAPVVCADTYAAVKNIKVKDALSSRSQVLEFLTEKKSVPGDDAFWDFSHSKGVLNIFSVKKNHLRKLWDLYGEMGLDEYELVLKPAALYDYAVLALEGKVTDFAVLNLSASLFNYLIVAGGRIFYMEIPGISMDDVVDEIKRSIEFLQVQEGIKGDVFQRIYAVIENEETRNRLAEKIKREIVPLRDLVAHTERIAGRKGYVPLMLGSMLADARSDKRFLSLKVNVKPRMQKAKEAARTLWRKHATVVFAAAALVFAGIDGLLLKNIAVLNGFLAANKERVGMQIPAYQTVIKEQKSLKTLDETVRGPIDDHVFVIAATNLIAEHAGDIAVMNFEYRAADRTVVLELESASYDVMSAFLKNIRSEGLFSKVTPVSSDTVKTGGGEAIHFKVELVR